MQKQSLKNLALKGMFWNGFESFFVQAIQFVIGIILARLLMPSDFGMIGMLAIFLMVSQILVQSGMGTALVQKNKNELTDADFSTVFVFNFGVSTFAYLVLYFAAPYIANFYGMPKLVSLTRVLSLTIIISAFSIVQQSRLTINMDFKSMAKVNIISILMGGIIAVYCAYNGMGVWALVVQNIVKTIVSVLLFWYVSKWSPSFNFSYYSFKTLFGFGSRLLAAGLYAQTLNNVFKIVIGKVYSAKDLGYYTQAMNIADMSSGTISNILQKVSFPILSSLQEDTNRLIDVYKRLIGMTSFFVLPLMTLFAILAQPFTILFLTEKWLPIVPLLQWLCFARIITPISSLNMNILNARGRSDLFLKVDLTKFPIIVIALVITIPLGLKAVVIGHFVTSLLSFFINAYMPGKIFGYGALSQIKDMIKIIIATITMSIFVYLAIFYIESNILKLVLGSIAGLISYFLATFLFKVKELQEIKILSNKLLTRRKH